MIGFELWVTHLFLSNSLTEYTRMCIQWYYLCLSTRDVDLSINLVCVFDAHACVV
jgi:hypothetical protein